MNRSVRHGKLAIRWSPDRGKWVLKRGAKPVTSSRSWGELHALVLRILDRERKEVADDARESVAR